MFWIGEKVMEHFVFYFTFLYILGFFIRIGFSEVFHSFMYFYLLIKKF